MAADRPHARRPPQNLRLGIALMIGGIALFAVGEAFVKALARDHSIVQIVWARYVFHAATFLVLFARTRLLRQVATRRPALQLARSILLVAATSAFFTALRYLTLADAVAINFVAPLLVTAFSIPILGEHVGARRWAAIVAGFAGVLVIIRPGFGAMHWAAVLPLVTALCYALYQIMTRIVSTSDDARTSLFWTSAVGVVVTSAAVPFFWTAPAAAAWAMMVALGVVYGIGHYLLIRALELAPASLVSPFIYTQIIWATGLGVVFFGQLPDLWTFLGAAIVIASGLYIWRRETARGGRAGPPPSGGAA